MSRLAIVIPAVGTVASLETTLLSVLENRPRGCEVIVVSSFEYDDPYNLQDEVRFLEVLDGDFVTCANAGIQFTSAPIVHLLAAGCEVVEGWTDAAIKHFSDSRVAAVAPLVLSTDQREHVLAAGIMYFPGGIRRQRVAKLKKLTAREPWEVFGACVYAAFFRRQVISAASMWLTGVGTRYVDIEVAWALRRASYRTVCDPAVQVFANSQPLPQEGNFQQGMYAERVFWRNAGSAGWLKSLLTHPLVIGLEVLKLPLQPSIVGRLVGRFWAACQVGHYVRHYQQLSRNAVIGKATVGQTGQQRTRIDSPHAGNSAASPDEHYSKRARSA